MDISGHIAILRAAFDAPSAMSHAALRLVMLGNAAVDARQTTPSLHFDNAPDRATVVRHWHAAVARPMERIVAWCAPRPDGGLRNRAGALWCFGQLTHTLQDFYAHTNWVELHLASPQPVVAAPLLSPLTVEQLPPGLQSGYFSLRFFTGRHRWSGCPVVAGQFAPPPPFSFCHALLAKDHPARGAGAQRAPDGTRLYDIAARLATHTTRDALACVRQRLAQVRGDDALFRHVFGLSVY